MLKWKKETKEGAALMELIDEKRREARKRSVSAKRKGSAAAHLLMFFEGILSHEMFDVVLSLVGAIPLGVMMEKGDFNARFWCVAIVYAILVLMSAWAKHCAKVESIHNLAHKKALQGINYILRLWAVNSQQTAKNIREYKGNDQEVQKQIISTQIDFQSAAFAVCEQLGRDLAIEGNEDGVYITVFQRGVDGDKQKCKMIAFSIDHEPTTYEDVYEIPRREEARLGEVCYHSLVFARNRKNIEVMVNQETVERAFVLHKEAKAREKAIQQYVCVPMAPAGEGVAFMIQIDTNEAGFFGKNKKEMKAFAKAVVYPYAQFLLMVYEQERLLEQILK